MTKYIGAGRPGVARGGRVEREVVGKDADAGLDVLDEDDLAPARVVRIDAALAGLRLDRALARVLPEVSRSRIQQWIEAGAVRRNGQLPRARDAVAEGDCVVVEPVVEPQAVAFVPEPMPLDIVHEDDEVLVLDKPPGLVVHPAAGHWSGTLLNGLLAHDPGLAGVPRAGIVHRLDADTSGLMVVARTLAAQTELVRQLQARTVVREYWAVVFGAAPSATTIDAPIGRDPRNPLRFRVSRTSQARPARTHLRCLRQAVVGPLNVSWVACRLETGRTHQIRVHLESIGHPLVGDRVYRRGRPAAASADAAVGAFPRQALHACRLRVQHPASRAAMEWFRGPPQDMRALMRGLGFRSFDRVSRVFD